MTSPRLVGKNARRFTAPSVIPGFGLTFGYTLIYLGLIVLFPLATLIWWSSGLGLSGLYAIASEPRVLLLDEPFGALGGRVPLSLAKARIFPADENGEYVDAGEGI